MRTFVTKPLRIGKLGFGFFAEIIARLDFTVLRLMLTSFSFGVGSSRGRRDLVPVFGMIIRHVP